MSVYRVTEVIGVSEQSWDRTPVNALSIALQGELRDAAEQVSADPDIRALVIYGGEKVFAAEADVKEMAARSCAEMAAISRRLHASFWAVADIGKPVVAAITGFALGGGLELALCADFRVAGENARFGLPEILLGVIRGLGGTQRLPRLIGPAWAKNLIYTGLDVGLDAGLEVERLHFAALFATEDQKLGMESFVASGPGKATFADT